MEDNLIVELYFERDERAIAETNKKYGKYCFSVANNILSNEQDSEECINDTWNRAWNAMPPQRPNNLKLFLAKLVRNLALDKIKHSTREKRGKNNLNIALDEISEIISDASNIEDYIESKEFMISVNLFLKELPMRDCNIFVSRYFYLETVEQISNKYALTPSNVNKILSRTRIKLKEFLKKEGYSV